MYYAILDSTGNLISCHQEKAEALASLNSIVSDEPEAVEDVALLAYDEDGTVAAGPMFGTLKDPSGQGAESTTWYADDSAGGEVQAGNRTTGTGFEFVV